MDEICANPFVLKQKITCLQWLKLIVTGILFLPIRVVVIVIFIFLLITSSYTLYFIKKYIHRPKDYSKVRHNYLYIPMFFLKAVTVAMGYWWIKVIDKSSSANLESHHEKHHHRKKNRNKSKLAQLAETAINKTPLRPTVEAPILAVVPHQSIFDFLAILYLGLPVLVARYEGSHHWMMRPLTKLFDPILVKRDSGASRKETANQIVKRASNDQVLLFPEGTDTTGHMILKLRMGAFKPKLPVQPVVIKYNYDDDIDNVSWVQEGPSFGFQVFMSLCKLYTRVSVTKYNIYFPNESDKGDAIKYSEHFHKYVCNITKYRYSHYTFGDSKVLRLCTECNLPRSPAACKLIHLAIKIFLSQVETLLPNTHMDENNVTYVSDRSSQGSPEKSNNKSSKEDNKTSNIEDGSNKDSDKHAKKDETVVSIESNQLFDKQITNICKNFIELSKKKGQEIPSNDHIKKWIDKPQGYELRKAIHETLANLVREAKFDNYEPDTMIDKDVLFDMLNLSNKYSAVTNSSVVRDVVETLTLNYDIKVSVVEFRAFMSLCHTQIKSMWERIEIWFRLLGTHHGSGRLTGDLSGFNEISLTRFKLLVWFLLGIEPNLIDNDMFIGQRITLRFVKENFVNLFKRAVEENASPLMTESGVSEDSIEFN